MKTIDEFAELAIRSRLISSDEMEALRGEFEYVSARSGSANQDVKSFSTFLVSRDVLTTWQCEKLHEGRWKGFFMDHYLLLSFLSCDDSRSYYLAEVASSHERVKLAVLRVYGRKCYEVVDLEY